MNLDQLEADVVRDAQRRLRKVEGQVRGVQHMIDEGRECEEVLRQIAAASSALRRAGVHLALSGLEHCVAEGPAGTEVRERFRRAFLELA